MDANFREDNRTIKDMLATGMWTRDQKDQSQHSHKAKSGTKVTGDAAASIDYMFVNKAKAARHACTSHSYHKSSVLEVQFNYELFADTLQRYEMPRAYPVEAAPPVDEEVKTYLATKAIQDTYFNLARARSEMTGDERWTACAASWKISTMQVRDRYGRQNRHHDGSANQESKKHAAAAHALPQNTNAPAAQQIRRTVALSRTVTEIRHKIARNTLVARMEAEKLWTSVKTLLKTNLGLVHSKMPRSNMRGDSGQCKTSLKKS